MNVLLEIGDTSAGGIVISSDCSQLFSAVYFEFDERTAKDEILIKLKKDLSIDDFKRKVIDLQFNISACVMIPDEFVNTNDAVGQTLSMLHGNDPFSTKMQGKVPSINATIGWKVNDDLTKAIEQKLAIDLSTAKHVFQKIKNQSIKGIELTCIVYPDVLRVLLNKNQQILFAGYFPYTEVHDGVYHLLHLVKKYEITAEDTRLELGGLITQESALFTQLNQYFGKVNCMQDTSISIKADFFDPYPIHFFGHLITHSS